MHYVLEYILFPDEKKLFKMSGEVAEPRCHASPPL